MRKAVALSELTVGESLGQDIFDSQGRLLLKEGTLLIKELIDSLSQKEIDTVYIDLGEEEIQDLPQEDNAILEAMEKRDAELQIFLKSYTKIHFEMRRAALRGCYNKLIQENLQRDVEELIQPYLFCDDHSAIQIFLHVKQSHMDYSYENHSLNTAILCALLGKWLSLSTTAISEAALTGVLHDIGENRIPQQILQKKGTLSSEEWREIKTHPEKGAVICAKTPWVQPRVTLAVLRHHERLDGTGYPTGCPGSDIPLYARLVAVAGSFDALTSHRPYRAAGNIFYAIADLRDRSFGQLDAKITRLLYDKILGFYVDKEVQLSNGQRGLIVMRKSGNIPRPLVKSGADLLDLTEQHAPSIISVYE